MHLIPCCSCVVLCHSLRFAVLIHFTSKINNSGSQRIFLLCSNSWRINEPHFASKRARKQVCQSILKKEIFPQNFYSMKMVSRSLLERTAGVHVVRFTVHHYDTYTKTLSPVELIWSVVLTYMFLICEKKTRPKTCQFGP